MPTILDGVDVASLYTERVPVASPPRAARVCVCVRAIAATVDEEVRGGADALWVEEGMTLKSGVLRVTDTLIGERPVVSSLAWHERGATVVDELALLLQAGTSKLEHGEVPALRVAVGRDVFVELCKLRALRICWQKLLQAAHSDALPLLHAVCSSRTMTQRDPWVNILRGTTQLFAAILGGADLVTPLPYDDAINATALGRRAARNAVLVLREESALGRVVDPAFGSYYLDTLTDRIARDAWQRFQRGVDESAIDDAYRARQEAIRTRKEPIVGVSEFANLDEPGVPPPRHDRRDAAAFEALRDAPTHDDVTLVPLGPAAEHRARLGFAQSFFPIGGFRTRIAQATNGVACLCGSDERYAADAVRVARDLKAAGCTRLLLAGKPGALEADLRHSGVDDFIFMGCDAVSVLEPLVRA